MADVGDILSRRSVGNSTKQKLITKLPTITIHTYQKFPVLGTHRLYLNFTTDRSETISTEH